MLNLISTPIGNLNDISLRAIDVLKDADYIFAEDTRNTNKLLKAINIDKKCRTLHEHNEFEVSKEIISLLKNNTEIINNPRVREIAATIREKESLAATRFIGIPDKNVHFLKLPFYETGGIKKSIPNNLDLKLTTKIISKIKPHQIYAAGDLADPHGTHKVCLDILFDALSKLKDELFMKDCWVWLYRGAWHEWPIHEIDMAVPMSPFQVLRKRKAIFYHQTQKDNVMFQGDDNREFWVRAEDRNRAIAKKFRDIGMSDYSAIETFKRYHF